MKAIKKTLTLTLTLVFLLMLFALTTVASENPTVILVGETINPITEAPYTLEEAWAVQENAQSSVVEVILKADNKNYCELLNRINAQNKRTTLRLTEDVTAISEAIILAKGATITIDLAGYTLRVNQQMGIHTGTHLIYTSSEAGGVLENLMDFPLFSLAPNSALSMNGITVRSETLFVESEIASIATFEQVHFDTVSLDFRKNKNVKIEICEGCTFDMNGAPGISEFGRGFLSSNVTLSEGMLLARTDEDDRFAVLSEEDTITITFRLEGEDITTNYQKGSKVYAPSLIEYGYTINGNYYYPVCEESIQELATEDALYHAKYTGGAQISANYSLNISIDFHAYIPATDEITHINGVEVSKLETAFASGQRYYVITFPLLAPKDAHDSLPIVLTVNLGKVTVKVERFVSLIGYAESAIEYQLAPEVINLILHTLDYINKTNIYFGGESSERIETLLSENGFTPYAWEAKNVKELSSYENLRGACLDLNQTPGFVFYVRADYEGAVTVNGKEYRDYSDPVRMDDEELKYIVVPIPAYQMADDLTVTAGEDTLIYNLDTYIAGRASSEPYAHALYGYIMACKNYIG